MMTTETNNRYLNLTLKHALNTLSGFGVHLDSWIGLFVERSAILNNDRYLCFHGQCRSRLDHIVCAVGLWSYLQCALASAHFLTNRTLYVL